MALMKQLQNLRVMSITATGTFHPTGIASGVTDRAGTVSGAADTRSGSASLFSGDANEVAYIHRINVVSGAASAVLTMETPANGEDVWDPIDCSVENAFEYHGMSIQGGFKAVLAGGAATIHIVYSYDVN